MVRFAIRRDVWLRPILWPFGGTAAASYVALEDGKLRVRFGWAFRHTFPLSEVVAVERTNWPWYYGLGWRANYLGRVGLVGSFEGIVELRLRRTRWLWLAFVPVPCRRLAISLEEPDAFVAALREALV